MTRLLQMFERRQFAQRRISIKSASSGTSVVSSIAAANRVASAEQNSVQESPSAEQVRSAIIQQIFINSSTGIKVGDEVHNHIHYEQLKKVKSEKSHIEEVF